MSDPVYPLRPGEPPELYTYGGMGWRLLHNTRPDADGRLFATRWLIVLLPIVPLGRYHVRRGRISSTGREFTIEYRFFGRSPLRPVEVIRTYVYFWVVVPVLFLGPIFVGAFRYARYSEDPDAVMVPFAGLSLLLSAVQVAVFLLYRWRWRPVRAAHRG